MLTDRGLLSALWGTRDGSFWDRSATVRVLFSAPPVTGVSGAEDVAGSVSDTSSSKYFMVFYVVGSSMSVKDIHRQEHIR